MVKGYPKRWGRGGVMGLGAINSAKEKRKYNRKWDQAGSRGMDPDSSSEERGDIEKKKKTTLFLS